jgi:hypothetical protein
LIKGKLPGIIGGLAVFLIILSMITYLNSDFDGELIQSSDNGIPAEKLIPKIDTETDKLKLNANRRFLSYVMDSKVWGNGSLVSKNDYEYYTEMYEKEMKVILEYENARKKFAKREITKEQFLQEIKIPKEYFNMF